MDSTPQRLAIETEKFAIGQIDNDRNMRRRLVGEPVHADDARAVEEQPGVGRVLVRVLGDGQRLAQQPFGQ